MPLITGIMDQPIVESILITDELVAPAFVLIAVQGFGIFHHLNSRKCHFLITWTQN